MKRLRSEWLVWALAAAAILAPAGGARTQDPGPSGDAASCPPDVADLSPTEYLKALSLDLRGVVPTVAEYEAISAGTDPASLVDEWLASDDFAARAVRRHRALLWDNISNVRLVYNRARLSLRDGVYWRAGAARYYGRLPPGGVAVPCLDEPATFNPDGTPVTRVVDGVPREGWVEVAPYWDPATPIHVCAFDAQTARTSPMGTDCSTRAAHTAAGGIYSGDPGCGCGPNLIWCDTAATHTEMVNAMTEDVERRIAAIVREDRPYTELFTSRRAYVNGPIVHYWKNLSQMYNQVRSFPISFDTSSLPALAYTDKTTWSEIELPEHHAGILTTQIYLLRFQTNRARANRFYDAFLCSPFQPPDGGLPVADPASALEPDLQLRAGCRYCHAILEPAASYWGRWTDVGSGFLDPVAFPAMSAECETCASRYYTCSPDCKNYYVTRTYAPEEEPYIGMLRAYEFRRPEHIENIEAGPKLLVERSLADGRLPMCAARRTAEWLLGRGLGADEQTWLEALSGDLVSSDYSYRSIVKTIALSETYRRVR